MTNEADTVKVELLPCPFCGGTPAVAGYGPFSIYCRCGTRLGPFYVESEAGAIAAWNRRLPHEAEGKADATVTPSARVDFVTGSSVVVDADYDTTSPEAGAGFRSAPDPQDASPQAVRARVIEAGEDNPKDWNTFTCWAEEPGIHVTAENSSGNVLLIITDGETIKSVATISRWRWDQLVTSTALSASPSSIPNPEVAGLEGDDK